MAKRTNNDVSSTPPPAWQFRKPSPAEREQINAALDQGAGAAAVYSALRLCLANGPVAPYELENRLTIEEAKAKLSEHFA